MSRSTSIKAFNQINEEGLLKSLQLDVYNFVYKNGPITAKDLILKMLSDGQNSGVVTTRLSELKRKGVLDNPGKTICKHTTREVLLWDVTSKIPKKLKPELTNKEKIKRLKAAHQVMIKHCPNNVKVEVMKILKGEIK